jgi:hypothetical protein
MMSCIDLAIDSEWLLILLHPRFAELPTSLRTGRATDWYVFIVQEIQV